MEPKLRFKADDGSQFPDWEEKTLGDIGTAKMCKRVLKEQTSEKGDVPFYKIGTFGGTPDAFISRELYEELKTKYSFPRKGNILLSAAGTIGRTVVYDGQDAFFQDSNIVWLDNDDSVLDGFLLQFYNKTSWDNLEGGTIKRLYNGLFLSKVIHVPSLPEQQKIAEFLSTIDTVIEKQKETVSAWEERKKGVMQKLFSQEIRFRADDGSEFPEWEEKKIGDLFYKVNERNNGQFGKDKWISVAKMYYQDEDKVTSNNIDTRTYVMRVGDMSFEGHPNKEFKYGRFVVNDIGDGIISELFPIYRHKENYILKYWKYAIQVDSIMQKVYRKSITSSGSSSNKLDDDDFKRQSILVPCLAEQQKIADCLSSLDEVIEKQKATLAAWEELKKGLLQQMFV